MGCWSTTRVLTQIGYSGNLTDATIVNFVVAVVCVQSPYFSHRSLPFCMLCILGSEFIQVLVLMFGSFLFGISFGNGFFVFFSFDFWFSFFFGKIE